MLPALFALSLFVSAALLFLVQPLVGKLLLPLLGGTPAVWNTCLVFFQALLLAGYSYAHLATARLGVRRQAGWHLLLLLVPLVALAIGLSSTGSPIPVLPALVPVDQDYPVGPLLGLLAVAIGVPFLVLSTTSPLLQRWLAVTAPDRDPYPLYAASNAGSLLGLLAYPLVVEPTLSLTSQQRLWAIGLVVYTVLVAGCALLARRYAPVEEPSRVVPPPAPPLSRWRSLRWLALSALTSAMLAAETTHLTTDMAPMPLLWVVPLALYLLSFVVVFAGRHQRFLALVARFTPMMLLFLVLVLLTGSTEPLPVVLGIHLGVFLAVMLVCHGELARDRPDHAHLTGFYLILSLGSVLGSLTCALIAPIVFHRLGTVEYPLLLVLVALVRPRDPEAPDERFCPGDVGWPLLLGLATALLIVLVPGWIGPPPTDRPYEAVLNWVQRAGLTFGLPVVAAYLLVGRRRRYALGLGALLLASALDPGPNGQVVYTERNFFGTTRVTRSPDGAFHRLVHGTTQHGQQRIDDDPPQARMYYHATGPVGRALLRMTPRKRRVGIVGLGCGALAAYARSGDEYVFFEIDPAVIRVARDTRFFTYLDRCKGTVRIVPGDARRQLEQEADGSFDVLVLDAFSSDAIPIHLLTREALALYLDRLAPGGLLLFHVSNRYLDLPPLLARLAADHDPPLEARMDHHIPIQDRESEGRMRSLWVALARTEEDLGPVRSDRNWERIRTRSSSAWTDDFSNVLGVWKMPEDQWEK